MSVEVGGVYEHYKGKQYRVLSMVVHSELLTPHVHYECLYENDMGRYWVRPLSNFLESVSVDGFETPRFKLIKD